MTQTSIINGAPQAILLGTKDVSKRQVPRTREPVPTHLPKFFFYARRGQDTDQLIGGDATTVYHTDTFDFRKKYANHSTVFINGVIAKGNACILHRVIPTDAGPKANVRLSLEVLEVGIQDYAREIDGSIKLDVGGAPVPLGTTSPGHKVRWVVTSLTTKVAAQGFGAGTVSAGTMVDPLDAANVSSVYPICDLMESSVGEDGNLTGFRMWAPTATSSGEKFDTRLLSSLKAYPVRFQVLRKNEQTTNTRPVESLSGAQSILGSLAANKIDTYSDAQLSLADTLVKSFNRVNSSLLPDTVGYLGDAHFYQANIDTLVGKFYAAEKAFMTAHPAIEFDTDFMLSGDEAHLFNFLGGTAYSGYPYHTYQIDGGTTGLRMTPYTAIDFAGGSDGTMNNTLFAGLVAEQMAEYANSRSDVQDDAYHVESVFYDTGFPLATKYKLLDAMAIRKDIAVAFSTYEAGTPKRTASQDNATAAALRARAQLYPESDTFGTGVMRVLIMGRSGVLIGSPYKDRVPGLYEVATKCANYMGASTGVWKNKEGFTGYPGSLITELEDIDVVFTPVEQRIADWDVGLNWIQRFGRDSYHIPAFKTVYEDDTSVLNSWITVLAICEINKVIQQVHRMFSGVDDLSNAQLANKVDTEIAKRLQGRFDGRFYIEVETSYTDADIARNYSWRTVVRLGASGTKTVMTAYVEAYRREDLQPGA